MHIDTWIRGRVHYGWIVVAVTFLTLLGAAGIRSTPRVLMIPLERHSSQRPAFARGGGAAFERLPPRALEHQTLDSVTFIFRPARPSLRALDVP